MKLILAGSNTRRATNSANKHGMQKLYSFFNEKTLIEKWPDDNFLMVDSGAHTWNKDTITQIGLKRKTKLEPARQFIKKYERFVYKYGHKKFVFVEFDVYGHLSVEEIDNFYDRIKAKNLRAHFMRVYHPHIDNGSLKTLKKWISQGETYIGIGNDSIGILDDIFDITRDKIRLHGFAMTKLPLLERYPFYSADSTSPLSTVIFGRYALPMMAYKERDDVFKTKSIECYHEDEERLDNAIKHAVDAQNYLTDLWTRKGVTWKDLEW